MRRGLVIAALVGGLLAIGAYGAASAVVYDKLTKVTGDCPAAWQANSPASFSLLESGGGPLKGHEAFDTTPYLMPEPETVSFPSRDPGIEISGWYLQATDPAAPAVVVVHGLRACKRDHSVLLPAGMLHREGFSVLLIDLRDHGDSTFEDGRYAGGTEEYRDVLGAWDWLQRAKGLPPDRIGLLGISLGAATVLIATGHEPGVAASWADSSYADLASAIEDELNRDHYPTFLAAGGVLAARVLGGDDLTSYSPLDGVHALAGRPVFLTHGDADGRVDVRYATVLADLIRADGGRVETWIVPGAGHTAAMILHPDEYETRLVDFFSRTIRP
jgi:uncharacterized protein